MYWWICRVVSANCGWSGRRPEQAVQSRALFATPQDPAGAPSPPFQPLSVPIPPRLSGPLCQCPQVLLRLLLQSSQIHGRAVYMDSQSIALGLSNDRSDSGVAQLHATLVNGVRF